MASSRGFRHIWIDTCCIDKSSSAELTESINTMYAWYRSATECLAYLSDVRCQHVTRAEDQREFSTSVWFTRGWTLQELIAPARVLFFNQRWEFLGRKSNLRRLLAKITSIDPDVLAGKTLLSDCTIAQRMSWAAKRTTTRIEDLAYSLLGIFNVYMPMLYGEGERAFQRLQEEIIKQSDDHTLFAWRDSRFGKSVLATGPSCFRGSDILARIFPTKDTSQGYVLVNTGLSIQLHLIPWSMNTYLAPLRCGRFSALSDESNRSSFRAYDRACIFLQQTDHDSQFIRVSVDDSDLVVINGDKIAEMRDRYGIRDKQIVIRKLTEASHITPGKSSFYGFTFKFNHESMFSGGRLPQPSDVLCFHKWKPHEPLFEIENGEHHAAGLFRLSGISTGHYIYFGFDVDFAPLCLITTRSPRAKRFSLLPTDFAKVGVNDALQLLDLNWLRTEIAEGASTSDTILAFRGEGRTKTKVECRSLSLSLCFEWKYSELVKMYAWQLTFSRSTASTGPTIEKDVDIKTYVRGSMARSDHTFCKSPASMPPRPRRSVVVDTPKDPPHIPSSTWQDDVTYQLRNRDSRLPSFDRGSRPSKDASNNDDVFVVHSRRISH